MKYNLLWQSRSQIGRFLILSTRPSHPGLAPFPAFASILAAFLHAQGNYNALHRFLRGVITSTWGVIGYFLVATYALAVAVALVLNA